jgi:hypothetical protein
MFRDGGVGDPKAGHVFSHFSLPPEEDVSQDVVR